MIHFPFGISQVINFDLVWQEFGTADPCQSYRLTLHKFTECRPRGTTREMLVRSSYMGIILHSSSWKCYTTIIVILSFNLTRSRGPDIKKKNIVRWLTAKLGGKAVLEIPTITTEEKGSVASVGRDNKLSLSFVCKNIQIEEKESYWDNRCVCTYICLHLLYF